MTCTFERKERKWVRLSPASKCGVLVIPNAGSSLTLLRLRQAKEATPQLQLSTSYDELILIILKDIIPGLTIPVNSYKTLITDGDRKHPGRRGNWQRHRDYSGSAWPDSDP